MHFNASPWARLLRTLPPGKLLLLGLAALGLSVGVFALAFGPLPLLRPVLPLFTMAGGVGVAALLASVFRLVWAGGRSTRVAGAVVLGAVIVGGGVVWYSVSVVREAAWRTCIVAATDRSPERRAAARAEGRAAMEGFFFRVSQLIRGETSIQEQCTYSDTDEARRAMGLCPRVIDAEAPCRCGSETFPRDITRDAWCKSVVCDASEGYVHLACRATSSPTSGASAAAERKGTAP